MKLVLAEKPSVAQSLAKVLGANKRCDGYLEGNGYVVSWCVGHLVELSQPEAYNETYAKWRLEDLPILPTAWKYQVSASTKKQFGILKDLMKREDVKSLVCATDAGREGELIFRLVYHQADCRKPFERLWISSMEDQAIRDGFAHLEPSSKYDALYEAALCRERADWIVGMNATRLFSCLYRQTLNVGRVMTPTLAMVVMRDAEIAAFVPKPFYTVQLGMDGITATSRRFEDKEDAQEVLAKCKESMKAMVKSMDRKEKTEHAPLLYDLTSLQRDANRILGFTAQQTLNYTQALYEKKLVTYPRTDSRYLTEDMKPMLPTLITQVAEKIGADAAAWKADNGTELSVDGMCDSRKVNYSDRNHVCGGSGGPPFRRKGNPAADRGAASLRSCSESSLRGGHDHSGLRWRRIYEKGQSRALWRLERYLATLLSLQGEAAGALRRSDSLSQCHGAFFSGGDQGRKDHSTQALHGGYPAFLHGNCWCGRYSGGCRAEGPGNARYPRRHY